MQNSMVIFLFLTIIIFLGANLVQKSKIVCWKLNLIQRLIRIFKIQWWSLFYLFWTENSCPFWANLIQKIAIVSLSWKLVLRLIWIWRIQYWCSFFCVFDRKYTSKNQNCLWKLRFRIYINLNMQKSIVIFVFLVRKYPLC